MDRAVFVERVRDRDPNRLTFLEANQRTRHATVDGNSVSAAALHDARPFADRQCDVAARHFVEAGADRPVVQITSSGPCRDGVR